MLQVGPYENCPVYDGSREPGPVQIGTTQVGPGQIGLGQVKTLTRMRLTPGSDRSCPLLHQGYMLRVCHGGFCMAS